MAEPAAKAALRGGARDEAPAARARRVRKAPSDRTTGAGSRDLEAVVAPVARETEARAPSVEEAVDLALHELGVSEQEVQVEVLQEPRSGLLGIGAHEAIVRVRVVGRDAEPDVEELEEQGDAAADFVEELLSHMGIDAVAEPNLHGGHMYVEIDGDDEDDVALLIGRHGQTLEAIQELTRLAVGRRLDQRVRVIVDAGGYRQRRADRLKARARETAKRVLRSGREEELDPMNPFERKIVHDAVAEISGVETFSRGEEPARFVVVRRR